MKTAIEDRLTMAAARDPRSDVADVLLEASHEIQRLRLTEAERTAIVFIAHNNPRDGFVRRTWLEFKAALCGLLERHGQPQRPHDQQRRREDEP